MFFNLFENLDFSILEKCSFYYVIFIYLVVFVKKM